jgi:hypothetical protein
MTMTDPFAIETPARTAIRAGVFDQTRTPDK